MKNQKRILVFIISILVTFIVAEYTGPELLSAEVRDARGDLVGEDNYRMPLNSQLQSFFTSTAVASDLFLLSTVPSPSDGGNAVKLSATVINPFGETAMVDIIHVYKNGALVYEERTQGDMPPGSAFIYQTREISLDGSTSQINRIEISVTLKSVSGATNTQTFAYEYLVLDPCESDDNCQLPYSVCDLENIAGFSSNSDRYCVRPCTDNTQCDAGQICKFGRCGY